LIHLSINKYLRQDLEKTARPLVAGKLLKVASTLLLGLVEQSQVEVLTY
jgi:hypothetical protein